jgi:hypothetical protein
MIGLEWETSERANERRKAWVSVCACKTEKKNERTREWKREQERERDKDDRRNEIYTYGISLQ